MMKANELRIGNWIKYTTDKDLSRAYYNKNVQVDIDIIMDVDHTIKSKWFQSIPLTPDILVKCGFTKKEDDAYYRIHKIEAFFNYEDTIFVYVGSSSRISVDHIKHLHQLQNLYFALTGSELPVNL